MNNFCLEIRFFQAQHALSDFFFKDRCFLCDFFSNLFPSMPPQFLLETKRFASIKDCSRFSALCDSLETFLEKIFQKNFKNFFSVIFCFLNVFGLERWVFCCFQLGKNGFQGLCVSLRVFFWRCKIDEILTTFLLPLVLRMIFLIWFCSKFATFFATVCEAQLRLCVELAILRTSKYLAAYVS